MNNPKLLFFLVPLVLTIVSGIIRYIEVIASGKNDMSGFVFSWSVEIMGFVMLGYLWKKAHISSFVVLIYAVFILFADLVIGNASFFFAYSYFGMVFPLDEYLGAMPMFAILISIQMILGLFLGQHLYARWKKMK